jgi:hypothetical protein
MEYLLTKLEAVGKHTEQVPMGWTDRRVTSLCKGLQAVRAPAPEPHDPEALRQLIRDE